MHRAVGIETRLNGGGNSCGRRSTDLETFTCCLDWFGETFRTQVIANEGQIPLLGTQLLADRKLTIDYQAKTVTLE